MIEQASVFTCETAVYRRLHDKPVAARIHKRNDSVRYSLLHFTALNSRDSPVSYSPYAFRVRVCTVRGYFACSLTEG